MSQVMHLVSFFGNSLHLFFGRNFLASFHVVNGVDAFVDNSGLSHLLDDSSGSVGRFVLHDLSNTDGLAFVTQSEATELRKSSVFLHRDSSLELNTDSSFSVGADVLGLVCFLEFSRVRFFSSDKDILDNTFVSEGVHVHHAGVTTRHNRLVG